MEECARVLKPGGILLLSEATIQGWTKLNDFRAEWGLPRDPNATVQPLHRSAAARRGDGRVARTARDRGLRQHVLCRDTDFETTAGTGGRDVRPQCPTRTCTGTAGWPRCRRRAITALRSS